MEIRELLALLAKAQEATQAYAGAIDSHLYRVGTFYARQEKDMYALADELTRAIEDIRTSGVQGG